MGLAEQLERAAQAVKVAYSECPSYDVVGALPHDDLDHQDRQAEPRRQWRASNWRFRTRQGGAEPAEPDAGIPLLISTKHPWAASASPHVPETSHLQAKRPPPPRLLTSPVTSCAQLVPALLEHGLWDLPQHCHFMPSVPIKPMLAKPTNGQSHALRTQSTLSRAATTTKHCPPVPDPSCP